MEFCFQFFWYFIFASISGLLIVLHYDYYQLVFMSNILLFFKFTNNYLSIYTCGTFYYRNRQYLLVFFLFFRQKNWNKYKAGVRTESLMDIVYTAFFYLIFIRSLLNLTTATSPHSPKPSCDKLQIAFTLCNKICYKRFGFCTIAWMPEKV